jgi:tRNA(fMet)-specific endonuclease VapC
MKYVLDTDHVTLHQRNHPLVVARIQGYSPDDLAITAITVQEQMRGRLVELGRARIDLTVAYAQLQNTVQYFCDLTILSFDTAAHQQYEQLRSQKIRIGTLDLRIAAIALSQDAILVTRNRRDFEQIPSLRIEDWSQSF